MSSPIISIVIYIAIMDCVYWQLAEENDAAVVAVDYRLAPETSFPGPLEDRYRACSACLTRRDRRCRCPAHHRLWGKRRRRAGSRLERRLRATCLAPASRSNIRSYPGSIHVSPWSNGQTEVQITKLKLVKRQMYGRAKLDLLEARLVAATYWSKSPNMRQRQFWAPISPLNGSRFDAV